MLALQALSSFYLEQEVANSYRTQALKLFREALKTPEKTNVKEFLSATLLLLQHSVNCTSPISD